MTEVEFVSIVSIILLVSTVSSVKKGIIILLGYLRPPVMHADVSKELAAIVDIITLYQGQIFEGQRSHVPSFC